MKINFYSHSFSRMSHAAGIAFLMLSAALFTGCRLSTRSINPYSDARLTVKIIHPQSSAIALQHRSAVPVLPEEQIFWKVEAENTSDSSITPEELALQSSSGSHSTTFILGISPGNWRINVLGFENEADSTEGLFEKAIFHGEREVFVNENGRYETSIQVYFIQSGIGDINLSIDVSATNLEKLTICGTDTSIDGSYFRNENGFFLIQKQNIQAGTYSPVLTFYEQETDFVQVISLQEKINVRQNLTTQKWIKSGNTIYLTPCQDNYADFVLTPEIILQLINTSFYVAGTNIEERKLPSNIAPPSDSNSGYWTAPFENIQAALNKIQVLNKNALENNLSANSNYTIYIDGQLYGQECSFLEMPDYPCQITIRPYKNPAGQTSAIIHGLNSNASTNTTNLPGNLPDIFTIDKNNTLILSDIEITGGNINLHNDGNLILQGEPKLSGGQLQLEENALILLDGINCPNNQTEQANIIANIKSLAPAKDKVILQGYNNQHISENVISRFRLKNPGYYLDYDENQQLGKINDSSVSILLPRIDACTVVVNAANSQNNITRADDTIIISQDFSVLPQITAAGTVFSVRVESPELNAENDRICLENQNITLALYVDGLPYITGSNSTENPWEKQLLLSDDFIFPGNYVLEVSYEYDGLLYDVKTLVRIL